MTAGRVLVTGASGFVGSHVVRALASHGVPARALLRDRQPVPPAWSSGVEIVRAVAFHDARAIADAVRGCSAVVHLAGRAHVTGEAPAVAERAFARVNVDGTLALARQSASAGVPLFVHVSSAGAVATSSRDVLTEATPPAPDTPYGRSKRRAELLLHELAATTRTAFVSLRPPMVYGPGMRGNPLRLFGLVARGVPLPVGRVRNLRSMVYVENLAEVIAAVLERPWRGAEDFFVADGPPLSTSEFARRAGDALGRGARVWNVPVSLLHAAAAAGAAVGRVTALRFDASTVDRLTSSLVVDDAALRRRIGPVPRVAIEDAFARTAGWFRAAHAPAGARPAAAVRASQA